jgi:predicted nucleic acid-binding protein
VPLICDTGPLLAALDRDDVDHLRCSALMESTDQDLVVPTRVLSELDRVGVVDATVIALAERFGEDKVATLDHRHFAAVRPRHARP